MLNTTLMQPRANTSLIDPGPTTNPMTPTPIRLCAACRTPGATVEAFDGEFYHHDCCPTLAQPDGPDGEQPTTGADSDAGVIHGGT